MHYWNPSTLVWDNDLPSGSETQCPQRWCWPELWCHPWSAQGSGSSWVTPSAQWNKGGGWCSSPVIGVFKISAQNKSLLMSTFCFLPWAQRKTRPAARRPPGRSHCSPPTGEPTPHGRAEREIQIAQRSDRRRGRQKAVEPERDNVRHQRNH